MSVSISSLAELCCVCPAWLPSLHLAVGAGALAVCMLHAQEHRAPAQNTAASQEQQLTR